ncbi:MAG TPA: hypothetical protein VNM24_00640 [Burkholderiales bacterium]|nr:hypothetical protein [Burkholderiales bacterium]
MVERRFELCGLDGANPLGFLAALGTLVTLHRSGVGTARLWWERSTRWVPILEGVPVEREEDDSAKGELALRIAGALRGRHVAEAAGEERRIAQKAMEDAKTAIKKKRDELKRRGLRGTERAEAIELELAPLERDYEEKRRRWLAALRDAVPRPELALGKRIEDAGSEEYRELAEAILAGSDGSSRDALDLLAALGSDACVDRNGRVEATPFEFTAGSGHQFFLNDVGQLMEKVTPELISNALFEPWSYRDEGLSLRWDPVEDRRYALLDRDPTDSKNKPRTVWMANLLGYCGLALFPAAPAGRRLAASGWSDDGGSQYFTWPLWTHPVSLDVVRSLVQLSELVRERPNLAVLAPRGIIAVYRAPRIVVGSAANKKLNFTSARQIVGFTRPVPAAAPRGPAGRSQPGAHFEVRAPE